MIRTWGRRLFFIGLFVAWFCAVQAALDGTNAGMSKLMDLIFTPAASAERYQGASESEWFTTLMVPGSTPPTSCCGYADAYRADETEPCKPTDGSNCWLVAVITDERPDTFQVDDGKGGTKTISRFHVDVGTRVPVPFAKRRAVNSANPTDHGIIFMGSAGGFDYYEAEPTIETAPPTSQFIVYCFEPLAKF